MEARASFGSLVGRQVEQHGDVTAPDLPEENAIDDLGGFDEFGENKAIVRRELGEVGGDIGWGEAGRHLGKSRGFGVGTVGGF